MIVIAITSSSGSSDQLPIISTNIAPIPASARNLVYITAPMPTKKICAVVADRVLQAVDEPLRR